MAEDEGAIEIQVSEETRASIAKLNSLKSISEILNFSAERELTFDPEREWNFSLDRDLNFDMERKLWFDSNREQGFGQRSVIFRGYICPTCKRQVGRGSRICSICGASYESPIRFGWKDEDAQPAHEQHAFAMRPASPETPAEHAKLKKCPSCKMKSPDDAVYCVECGERFLVMNVKVTDKGRG